MTYRALVCALPGCGEGFYSQHPRTKFCSPRCQVTAAQRAYRLRRRAARKTGELKLSFAQWHPFEHLPFRSLVCALPGCGTPFQSQHPQARYCSNRCADRASRQRRAGSRLPTPRAPRQPTTGHYENQPYVWKTCPAPECGQEFPTQNKQRRYCSLGCQRRHYNRVRYWRNRDACLAYQAAIRRARGQKLVPGKGRKRGPCPYPEMEVA